MDDIILTNSDVLEVIEDVPVIDKVYIEDGKIKLDQEQIIMEVANLLSPHLPVHILQRKTELYMSLFKAPVDPVPFLKTLYTIVNTNKVMMEDDLKPSFAYRIDLDLDPDNNIKGQKLLDFLNAYKNFNHEKSAPYINTSQALYELFKPYTLDTGTVVDTNIDVVWQNDNIVHKNTNPKDKRLGHSIRPFRVLKSVENDVGYRPDIIDAEYLKENKCPQGRKYIERSDIRTLYSGDKITVAGYLNIVDADKGLYKFNLKEYRTMLSTLVPNSKVVVYFNTIAYDIRNKLVREVDGIVVDNDGTMLTIEIDKNVDIEDTQTKTLFCPIMAYVPFFVYNRSYDFKYHKQLLLTHNIQFECTNKDYVFPCNWAEYKLISNTSVLYHNLSIDFAPEIKRLIQLEKPSNYRPAGVLRVYSSKHKLLNFSDHKTALQYYKIPYNGHNVDSEMSRLLYLLSKPDKGLLYFKSLKHNVSKDISGILHSLQEKIGAYVAPPEKHPDESNRVPRIVKRYDSLKQLNEDNGKIVYVDKKYDHTNYTLKTKLGLHGNELWHSLLVETGDDFEAKCIIDGKRPVKEGDVALVGTNLVFKRAIISGKEMWIKTTGLPVCETELKANETKMVLDTYDNLCKSVDNYKSHHEYLQKRMAIKLLEDFNKEENSISDDVLIHMVNMFEHGYLHRISNSMFGYIERTSYDDYQGKEEAYNLSNMYMNFAYGDGPSMVMGNKRDEDKATLLDMICKVLDVDFPENDRKAINNLVDKELPDENAQKEIEMKNKDFNRQIAQLLESNKKKSPKTYVKLKMELESKKAEKIDVVRYRILSTHNFAKVLLCCAHLLIVIVIKHPAIMIKRLIPKCVQHFSYNDYLNSLIKYMACVLKTLHQPKDIRFGMFEDMEANEVALKRMVEKVLKSNQEYAQRIVNVNIKDTIAPKVISYDQLNTFYKPCFDFSKSSYQNSIIEYLRTINDTIKSAKKSRFNIINMPLIANMCCTELLVRGTNYYTYFSSIQGFSEVQQKAKQQRFFRSETVSWKAKGVLRKFDYLFGIKPISHTLSHGIDVQTTDVDEFHREDPEGSMHNTIKVWWIALSNMLTLNDKIKYIEKMMISIEDLDNLLSIRNVYASGLRGQFISCASRLLNLHRYSDDVKIDRLDPMVKLLETLYDFESMKPYLSLMYKELDVFTEHISYSFSSDGEGIDIIYFSNELLDLFARWLFISTSMSKPHEKVTISGLQAALETNGTEYSKVTLQIIQVLLEKLYDYFVINYFDYSSVKKAVEILRERNKEEIMAKYSKDDEKRAEQKMLKKMGLGVFEADDMPLPEIVVPVHDHVEAEFGDYVKVVGENDENDIDHDGFD